LLDIIFDELVERQVCYAFKQSNNFLNSKLRQLKIKEKMMEKYRCIVCGYIYDPAENDNVSFEDLPEDWVCPECGAGKDQFEKY